MAHFIVKGAITHSMNKVLISINPLIARPRFTSNHYNEANINYNSYCLEVANQTRTRIQFQHLGSLLGGMSALHGYIDCKCSTIPFPSTTSCNIIPAAASIARRPLEISLVCITNSSLGFFGLKQRGSNPTFPGS